MRVRTLPVLFLFFLLGCMEGDKPLAQRRTADGTPAKASLYDRLGGEKAIAKVVDDLVANVVADERLRDQHKKHFMEGDVAGLKRKLIDQVGEATGGPQKYTGKNMKEAHRGLGIGNADFDALIDDLARALDKNGAGQTEKDELFALLEKMRRDVVEKRK